MSYGTTLMHGYEQKCGRDEGKWEESWGNQQGEAERKSRMESGPWPSHAIRLALGAQFHILHWQFESQGRGSQGVDHVLVTLPTVLS